MTEQASFIEETPEPLPDPFQDRSSRIDRHAELLRLKPKPLLHTPAEALGPLANPAMWEALELMGQQMNDAEAYRESQRTVVTQATASIFFTLSAGVVTWVLRAGSLMASLLSSMPLWRGLDPLPVLLMTDDKRKRLKLAIRDQEADEAQDEPGVGRLFESRKTHTPKRTRLGKLPVSGEG